MVLQFLLIVVILAAVLYSGGEAWGIWVRRFGRRLADEQGDRMVVLAGQAIRGVALGVVVTALTADGARRHRPRDRRRAVRGAC